VVGRSELMDAPGVGGLGGTYGGNPLACAAAHAVLDLFEDGRLVVRAEAIGARIEARLREWAARMPLLGEVRRRGAMAAVELVRDRASREPAKEETAAIVREAAGRGVLLVSAGTYGNVIRFLAPLVIEDEELDEGLSVVGECFEEILQTEGT